MKKIIIAILAVIILGGVGYFLAQNLTYKAKVDEGNTNSLSTTTPQAKDKEAKDKQEQEEQEKYKTVSTIGTSVEGRDIKAYTYGNGDKKIVFIAGIHGGYSWNTPLLAYRAMDYFEKNKKVVPENVEVTVIPVMNPDGLYEVVDTAGRFRVSDVPDSQNKIIPGRFNTNDVDLNRNFDCDWSSQAKWQNKDVSGGNEPFSEPESKAIKSYIENNNPDAVIVWYSAAGGVFASSCHNGVLQETRDLTNIYADASGYKAYEEFNFYEVKGDMVNWLAKKEVPAISVLPSTHEDIEWNMNKAGIKAVLKHYAK